jgi:hypothetical protein
MMSMQNAQRQLHNSASEHEQTPQEIDTPCAFCIAHFTFQHSPSQSSCHPIRFMIRSQLAANRARITELSSYERTLAISAVAT